MNVTQSSKTESISSRWINITINKYSVTSTWNLKHFTNLKKIYFVKIPDDVKTLTNYNRQPQISRHIKSDDKMPFFSSNYYVPEYRVQNKEWSTSILASVSLTKVVVP